MFGTTGKIMFWGHQPLYTLMNTTYPKSLIVVIQQSTWLVFLAAKASVVSSNNTCLETTRFMLKQIHSRGIVNLAHAKKSNHIFLTFKKNLFSASYFSLHLRAWMAFLGR